MPNFTLEQLAEKRKNSAPIKKYNKSHAGNKQSEKHQTLSSYTDVCGLISIKLCIVIEEVRAVTASLFFPIPSIV